MASKAKAQEAMGIIQAQFRVSMELAGPLWVRTLQEMTDAQVDAALRVLARYEDDQPPPPGLFLRWGREHNAREEAENTPRIQHKQTPEQQAKTEAAKQRFFEKVHGLQKQRDSRGNTGLVQQAAEGIRQTMGQEREE